jgi:hypothetical protein
MEYCQWKVVYFPSNVTSCDGGNLETFNRIKPAHDLDMTSKAERSKKKKRLTRIYHFYLLRIQHKSRKMKPRGIRVHTEGSDDRTLLNITLYHINKQVTKSHSII